MKFYMCEKCGNIVCMMKESGVSMMCCGQKMTELIPGTVDGAVEKHIPVYRVEGNKLIVKVGSTEHPMVGEHFIEWIVVETDKGVQLKMLKPGQKPCAEFMLMEGETVLTVQAYCNIHGLW